jgi:hypothetical protein
MAHGDPATSPWVWEAQDYLQRAIRITVTFNDTTRAITGITAFRTSGCLYTKILIGTSADGVPDDTDKIVTVPVGTTNLTQNQLNNLAARGLATIEDILALQITAGR